MKSPLTTSLHKQTPRSKKAITFVTAEKSKFTPMKNIFQFVFTLIVSLMATSCYYDEMPVAAEIPIPAVVSYSKDIQPLWDQDCVSCHKGTTPPDLTAANSYAALTKNNKYVLPGNAAGSSLHKSLVGDGAALMPPAAKWSDSKIALVDKWINDGALNN